MAADGRCPSLTLNVKATSTGGLVILNRNDQGHLATGVDLEEDKARIRRSRGGLVINENVGF